MSTSNLTKKSFLPFRGDQEHQKGGLAVRELPWLTLSLCAAMVSLLFFPEWIEWLELNREAFLKGEFWRLFTSHFVHYSPTHLFWDVLMFLLLGWMIEREGAWRLALLLLGTCLAVSSLYLVFPPEGSMALSGASALDSALLSALYISTWRDFKGFKILKYLVVALFLAFWVKIIAELLINESVFSVVPGDATIYPPAHILGALFGLLFSLTTAFKRRSGRRSLSLPESTAKNITSTGVSH